MKRSFCKRDTDTKSHYIKPTVAASFSFNKILLVATDRSTANSSLRFNLCCCPSIGDVSGCPGAVKCGYGYYSSQNVPGQQFQARTAAHERNSA